MSANFQIKMPLIDLSGIPDNDRHPEAYRLAVAEAQHPFNLTIGPLLRLKLIRLAAEEHLLLCVMHHIVCDGWSLEIFVRELAALYGQHAGGATTFLPDLPIQYGDYANWQREWIAGDLLKDQARYWNKKLASAPSFLSLPTDRLRPPKQNYNGASQIIPIPKYLVQNLADFSRTRRATLFMAMLAIFKILLHAYSGSDDILVGVPVAGRNRVELEGLVGFFVNTLVLRTDFSSDSRFSDLLLQVREAALDAFANADLPFEKLVEDLNPPRTLSYSPVIQIMFSTVKVKKSPNFGDVSASSYIFSSHTSLFDLSIEFIEDAQDRSWLRVEYDTSLFDYARIIKMLNDYVTLIRAIAAQPELRISRLTSLLHMEGDPTERNGHAPVNQEAKRIELRNQIAPNSHSEDKGEPRDALELILVRIWERVLGTSGIGIRDNFFDLGGHSLLAAQLVSEVEKAIGRTIPLSALFRGSTIESFADVIRCGTEWSPDPLVMELAKGTGIVPLFAVVQSGVDALGYGLLARHIGAKHSVYKLQAHTPFCHIVPFTIEELRTLAREYIAAMRAVQAKGPYFLIGMCNGVHIAEQMVIELEAQGHEVGFFGIIDTFVAQGSVIRWLRWIQAFRISRPNISSLPLFAQISYYKQAAQNSLRGEALHESGLINPWTKAFGVGKEFHLEQFRAPVILFRVPKQPYFMVRDRKLGWGARSSAEIKICTVNSTHEEMLREPAVQVIAEQLKEALNRFETVGFSHPNHD